MSRFVVFVGLIPCLLRLIIGIADLRRKRLLGKHMTQELLDKGFVSVLDLRFHPIMEIYGSRRSDHSECRRLRLTFR